MKILAHKPRRPRKKEHIAIKVDNTWVAMCRHDLREGDRTDKGVWAVREQQHDDRVCMGCDQVSRCSQREPETRELPCTEPGRQVELLERTDGRSLVHATTARKQWAFCKASSRSERGWQTRKGIADEITCSRCLKSLGLYEGHKPAKRSGGNLTHHAMVELWDAWLKWHGERHYSDPRNE